MKIQTVKIQDDGYLVNSTDFVPNEEGNRHYKMVQDFISKGGTVEPEFAQKDLLVKAKGKQKAEMIAKYDEVSIESVPVNGISYNGGYDSALKLDGAKRLAELAGLTEVTFYDIDNKPNILSIADAVTVILAISAKVQTDFKHLQSKKVLIDSKVKVTTIEAVTW